MQHSSTPLSSEQILAVLVLITAVLSVVNEEVVEFLDPDSEVQIESGNGQGHGRGRGLGRFM
jgi:hypothetical protein